MKNQQILEKAITKAIDGGWVGELRAEVQRHYKILIPERYIFNHDFAKSLWGEEYVFIDTGEYGGDGTTPEESTRQIAWQYHLQQMVIADDPIKYLGENT